MMDSGDYLILINSIKKNEDPECIVSGENPNKGKPLTNIAISPKGDIIGTSSERDLHLWNAEDGKLIVNIQDAHSMPITCMSWSPDNEMIATGGADRTIRLFKHPRHLPTQKQ